MRLPAPFVAILPMNPACKSASRFLLGIAATVVIGVLFWVGSARHDKPAIVPAVVTTAARHDLVMRDGRWCKVSATNAFTGLMLDYYPNGAMMARAMISNGLPDGCSETWYTNGQLQLRECFRNGVSDGLREKWHQNGRKLSEATLVGGKITGLFQSWHENGKLSEQIQMKQGQPDGVAWAYYPSGFAKAEIALQDGKVLNRKSWKDGQYKTTQ
jgi:hypothetical protein